MARTGDPAAGAASDTGVMLAALGHPLSLTEFDRVSPWRYAAPLSPDMAAWKEAKAVDFDALVEFCRHAIANHQGTLLIEGIGGVMVPLGVPRTTLDWMLTLGLPIVLVTGSYLGTISHTLSAIDVILRRNLQIAAVVVNESEHSTVALDETAATIKSYLAASPASTSALVTIPRNADDAAFNVLADVLTAK